MMNPRLSATNMRELEDKQATEESYGIKKQWENGYRRMNPKMSAALAEEQLERLDQFRDRQAKNEVINRGYDTHFMSKPIYNQRG